MEFCIDFNKGDYYNDEFLIEKLGGVLTPLKNIKYPPFEYVKIEVRDFEHLKEILELVDEEFKTVSSAHISFDSPTIFIDL